MARIQQPTGPAFEVDRDGRPIKPADWRESPGAHALSRWPAWAELYEPQRAPDGQVIGHWFETVVPWRIRRRLVGGHDTPIFSDLHWGNNGLVGTRQQAALGEHVIIADTLALYLEARRRAPFVPRLAIRMAWSAGEDATGGVLDMVTLRPSARVLLCFANEQYATWLANRLRPRVQRVRIECELDGFGDREAA